MTCQPPAPEQVASIARSARSWLVSLLDDIPAAGDAAVRALCHVLIASWIADTMAGGDSTGSSGFREVAPHVARSLNAAGNSKHVGVVKPALRLLTELFLSVGGFSVAPLREFLTQSAAVLRLADPALQADPFLADKRIILHSAGILPPPPKASADGTRALIGKFRLSAPTEVIDALTLQLEYLTGYGTRLIDTASISTGLIDTGLITPPLGEILAGLAVHRLRNYELAPAARLLRLHEYLAASHAIARRDDLYHNLCTHHRAHGPFGWYGPEAARLRKLSPALQADLEFYLPATLECLWTLAERSLDNWRLFAKVPTYTPLNGGKEPRR